ncbi:hypothetical protein LOTGIDRAFT_161699 [Lottia gigantea]|uniref:Protein ARV n=1 Tax=Lottia gigantea TaxID=225164 RepID=V3ZQB7_LOTGI|nr:hypothetical protein LOTGIDRAFT_161699 [Lottia gigantea]ESO93588.1 hypothetical protein LOTGIDRAFT_161699 [Lottia gigantea]
MATEEEYQCIECGCQATNRYQILGNKHIIKITHCKNCEKPVDKYIEYDSAIIYLDAMLLKIPVYRHILVNEKHKFCDILKLIILLLSCDALSKWKLEKSEKNSERLEPIRVFYAALEIDLYWNYFLAVCQWFVYIATLVILIYITEKFFNKNSSVTSYILLVKSVVISNFGKTLVLITLLWGSSYSYIYLILGKIFVTASNIQALRVITSGNKLKWSIPRVPSEISHLVLVTIIVILATIGQELVLLYLPNTIQPQRVDRSILLNKHL